MESGSNRVELRKRKSEASIAGPLWGGAKRSYLPGFEIPGTSPPKVSLLAGPTPDRVTEGSDSPDWLVLPPLAWRWL